MKIFKPNVKLLVLGVFLAVSAGAGAATNTEQGCCYPGTKYYYDDAGDVVGFQMIGCGDDRLYGRTTSNAQWRPGCAA